MKHFIMSFYWKNISYKSRRKTKHTNTINKTRRDTFENISIYPIHKIWCKFWYFFYSEGFNTVTVIFIILLMLVFLFASAIQVSKFLMHFFFFGFFSCFFILSTASKSSEYCVSKKLILTSLNSLPCLTPRVFSLKSF